MGKVFKKSNFFNVSDGISLSSNLPIEVIQSSQKIPEIKNFSFSIHEIRAGRVNNFTVSESLDSGVLISAFFSAKEAPSSVYENLYGGFLSNRGKISKKKLIESEPFAFFPISVEFQIINDGIFDESGLIFRIISTEDEITNGLDYIVSGSYRKTN